MCVCVCCSVQLNNLHNAWWKDENLNRTVLHRTAQLMATVSLINTESYVSRHVIY